MGQEDRRTQIEEDRESPEDQNGQDPTASLVAERDQYRALAQRTQADFINYKRRMDEERSLLARNAANNVILRVATVLDDLQRAVDAVPADAPASWSEGVRLVLQNLQGVIQSEGVVAYEPAPGDRFDPLMHEAVYYQPSEEQTPGSVLASVRRGYRTQDRVLRPAQVVVAREPQEQAAPEGND